MSSARRSGTLELRLIGRFVVVDDGAEVPAARFRGRKARTLLRMLAARRRRMVTNDELAEGLWPEGLPADPAANLQVLVNRVRSAVGRPDLVVTGTGGYSLTAANWCLVDGETLLDRLDSADRLVGRAALARYLEAFGSDPVAPEPLAEDRYDDWSQSWRARILDSCQAGWERAAGVAIECGEPVVAVRFATLAATMRPLREAAALVLVRALTAAGDRAAALTSYDSYRRLLADELGIDPSPAAGQVHAEVLRAQTLPGPAISRTTSGMSSMRTAFVGREDSLRRIDEALAAHGAGRPTVIRIVGRSGSGKSRLLAEVAARTSAALVRASWANRDEAWTLGRAILRELIAADVDTLDALPAAMNAALLTVVPELVDIVPATTDVRFDPATRWALVVEATARLFCWSNRLLIVDDLQWADARSLQLLAALADLPGRPSIAVAFRPDDVRTGPVSEVVSHLPDSLTVELGQLPPEAIESLIADPALAAALSASPDRSPLAITELLRALAAEGTIGLGPDGRWRAGAPEAAARAGALARAGHLRAIRDRVAAPDGLAATAMSLLAIHGREVSAAVLARCAGVTEPEMLGALTSLAHADLVRSGELGWRFSHDSIGEAVLAQLGDADRPALHARVAAVMEAGQADAAERARHWRAAGDLDRAGSAYAQAAEAALAASAFSEAADLAEVGLSLGRSLPDETRWRLLEVRGGVRQRLGDLQGARADLRATLDPRRPGPDRALVLADLAMLASGADDLVRAGELAEAALVEARQDDHARARALEVASVVDMNLDRVERSRRRADEALTLYTRAGDSRGAARILDARAMATFLNGTMGEGVDLLGRAAALFEDSGDLLRMITPESTCGHGWVLMGEADAGLPHTDRALDTARILGNPEGIAYASWHRSEALSALGRHDDALDAAREALDTATRIGHRGWTATAWRATGIARQESGDQSGALAAFRSSLDLSRHLDLFGCWAAARAAIACVRLARLDDAEAFLAMAVDRGPALGRHEARWATAELAVARQDPDSSKLIDHAESTARTSGAGSYLARLAALRRQA